MNQQHSEVSQTQLRQKAVWILGQRDHGREELRDKLRQSVARKAQRDNQPLKVTEQQLDQVIGWCQQQGFLDDAKFSRHYLQQRSRRGYGLQRIRLELQRKGVDNDIIDLAIEQNDIDWIALAEATANKKVAGRWPTDYANKAKLQRYLYSRGYLNEEIRAVFENISF